MTSWPTFARAPTSDELIEGRVLALAARLERKPAGVRALLALGRRFRFLSPDAALKACEELLAAGKIALLRKAVDATQEPAS